MSKKIPAKPTNWMHLPRREESFRDATLIEHLDGAGVKTPGSRSVEILTGASFDDDDVDPRQRQLARQHQPGRTASCDHHRMFGHRRSPANAAPDRDSHLAPIATARQRRSPASSAANSSTGSALPLDPSAEGNTRIPQLLAATLTSEKPLRCKGFSVVAGAGFEPATFGL